MPTTLASVYAQRRTAVAAEAVKSEKSPSTPGAHVHGCDNGVAFRDARSIFESTEDAVALANASLATCQQ